MATTTTNLGLTKPAGTEAPDIAVINANMDLIDTAVGNNTTAVAARSISYNFGSITAADIGTLVNLLIGKFNTCANGAHCYYGIWSGNYYFGGTIHKNATDLGVMTFFPSALSSTQESMKIFNGGVGWNSTNI